MNIGDEITLNPTEGGYQTQKVGEVVHTTPTRVTVRIKGRAGLITFNKATGRGQFKPDREFPNYIISTESEA